MVQEAVRGALVPLEAAAPIGGAGGDMGPWQGIGGALGGGVPLELCPANGGAAGATRGPELLQVFDSYILFQTDGGVAIVDQHSAHERVLYEGVLHQLQGDGAPAQRLLLPLTLDFTPPELEAIDEHRELLRRVGFELEALSGRSVIESTAPNPHPRFEQARCLQELVADLALRVFGGFGYSTQHDTPAYAFNSAVIA